MEFEKQVAKEGFQTVNAEYLGLVNKAMTGTGKKGDWRKIKTRWLLSGRQNENKFIIWTPLTSKKTTFKSDIQESEIKPEQIIKPFTKYRIGWFEKEEEYEGKEWVSKTIVVINEASDDDDSTAENSSQTKSVKPDLSQFETFFDKYKAVCKEKNLVPNAIHLLGSYIAATEYSRVSELLTKCESVIDSKGEPIPEVEPEFPPDTETEPK